jgi:hypothetical protein
MSRRRGGHFGISRETFYEWKRAFETQGDEGLVNRRPGLRPGTCPHRTTPEIEAKILDLRTRCHISQLSIFWYLHRRSLRRFQYTAIDDATGIRALRIHRRHAQRNAIELVD